MTFRFAPAVLLCILAAAVPASAAPSLRDSDREAASVEEIADLELEELLQLEVVSASRKLEPVSETASAVYVVTQDDLRRSGATSIPEALRSVPGLQVFRTGANQWAVSSRGFNGIYANKLLVLIDGRSVFNPLFSGVYWDVQDTPLEDVERIEIVRGPGGALWGTNAVNGVINVITKSSRETEGTALSVGGGTRATSGLHTLRTTDEIGNGMTVRAYAKYWDQNNQLDLGNGQTNEWNQTRGGFRMDGGVPEGTSWSLAGDIYRGANFRNLLLPDYATLGTVEVAHQERVEGGHILGRWERPRGNAASSAVQAYYDRNVRETAIQDEISDVFDVELQQRERLFSRNDLVVGGGVRHIIHRLDPSSLVRVDDPQRTLEVFSAYAQNELAVTPEALRLTVGLKGEWNEFTQLEMQPSVRALWKLDSGRSIWGSAARAVASPSRYRNEMGLDVAGATLNGMPALIAIESNPGLQSESVDAVELGFRTRLTEHSTFDLALFSNQYHELIALRAQETELQFLGAMPYLRVPQKWENSGTAHAVGGEAVLDLWFHHRFKRLQLSYSHLEMDYDIAEVGATAPVPLYLERSSPRHQAFATGTVGLGRRLEAQGTLRFRSRIEETQLADLRDAFRATEADFAFPSLAAAATCDLGITWNVLPALDVNFVALDLFERDEPEFIDFDFGEASTPVRRSFFLKASWKI